MSIHLSCYTKLAFMELQRKLEHFEEKYPNIFPVHYVLSTAGVPHPIQKEIANEFGLDPTSYFLVSVNDKSLEISTDIMATMIKKELGKSNVIILYNGEELL